MTSSSILPVGWRSLWRAHSCLPASIVSEPFTVFVRAVNRDAAHATIQHALQVLFPSATLDMDEAYYNLSSASELIDFGVSERHVDRLFETAWSGNQVGAWVQRPVFVVPDAGALHAAWITAQLDQSSQYATLDGLPTRSPQPTGNNPRTSVSQPSAAVAPIRLGTGFLIPGKRLNIRLQPSGAGGRERISAAVSLTAEAINGDRGVLLTRGSPDCKPDEIRINGEVLECAAQFYADFLAGGVTDYREGFSVTLEPGQAAAVRRALTDLRRVLSVYDVLATHLASRLAAAEPSPWYVEEPLFKLVVASVLDGADRPSARAAYEKVAQYNPDAMACINDPATWAAFENALASAPQQSY